MTIWLWQWSTSRKPSIRLYRISRNMLRADGKTFPSMTFMHYCCWKQPCCYHPHSCWKCVVQIQLLAKCLELQFAVTAEGLGYFLIKQSHRHSGLVEDLVKVFIQYLKLDFDSTLDQNYYQNRHPLGCSNLGVIPFNFCKL